MKPEEQTEQPQTQPQSDLNSKQANWERENQPDRSTTDTNTQGNTLQFGSAIGIGDTAVPISPESPFLPSFESSATTEEENSPTRDPQTHNSKAKGEDGTDTKLEPEPGANSAEASIATPPTNNQAQQHDTRSPHARGDDEPIEACFKKLANMHKVVWDAMRITLLQGIAKQDEDNVQIDVLNEIQTANGKLPLPTEKRFGIVVPIGLIPAETESDFPLFMLQHNINKISTTRTCKERECKSLSNPTTRGKLSTDCEAYPIGVK